jgi:hypothetical protein
MLFSTRDPADRLTAVGAAAPRIGLVAASLWWPIAAILAFAYSLSILRFYGGKVDVSRDDQGLY